MSPENKGSAQSQPVSAPKSAAPQHSSPMENDMNRKPVFYDPMMDSCVGNPGLVPKAKTSTPDLAALVVALREAAEKATPGPWVSEGDRVAMVPLRAGEDRFFMFKPIACLNDGEYIENPKAPEDSAFIAVANPANILALLDAYAEQGRKLEACKVVDGEVMDHQAATIASLTAEVANLKGEVAEAEGLGQMQRDQLTMCQAEVERLKVIVQRLSDGEWSGDFLAPLLTDARAALTTQGEG